MVVGSSRGASVFPLTRAAAAVGAIVFGAAVAWVSPTNGDYAAWSLLPAAVTIAVCFATRNVLLALFLGIVMGGLISGQYNLIDAYFIPSLGSESYAQILLVYLWALGGLLGIWNATGGARHFAESVAQRMIRSRRTAKFFAWTMGVLFHQGGTISTVLAGTTVRPISDEHGVAHEELTYVVDSTASPIATLIPFNVWPIYVAGLITVDSLREWIPDEQAALEMFYSAIPFNFYAWIAVTMTLLFAFDRLPLARTPMAKAVQRVRETSALDDPRDHPLVSSDTEARVHKYSSSHLEFLLPMGVLMSLCIIPILFGRSPMVFEGFGLAMVTAMAVALLRGMSVQTAFQALVKGIQSVTIGAIVLGMAVTLAAVAEDLGTAQYVISVSADLLRKVPFILPAALLAVSMLVAFSIGSSWGTYAVMFPIALPLAFTISVDPTFVLMCFGALLGGAVFGDQCSPISDTTILSSLACGADVMAHVRTQLPLAAFAAALAAVIYTLLGVFL